MRVPAVPSVKLTSALLFILFFGFPYAATCQTQERSVKNSPDKRTVTTITSHTSLPMPTSGAGRIVVKYVNPLRFQYSLQVSSTNIPAPTPPGVIAPSASTGGKLPTQNPPPPNFNPPPPTPPPGQQSPVDLQWLTILSSLSVVRQYAFALKQQTDTLLFAASMEAQCYKDRLSFYSTYLLDENAANSLKKFVANNRTPTTSESNSASDSCRRSYDNWPFAGLQSAEKQIYTLQTNLFDLANMQGFAAWKATASNGDNYTAAGTQLASLLTQVQTLEATSDVAKNFQAAQVYNYFWRSRIEAIAKTEDDIASASEPLQKDENALKSNPHYPDPLTMTINLDCSTNWYGRGRTDTVTLHYADVSVTPSPDQTSQIAVNTCYTPATVSTGIGMSFLRNRQYGFVSGRDPNNPMNTISVIGTTTDQQVTPLYALQYNIALRDFENGLGLHATVGAALGSSSGTANIELIAGPAISIRRRAFFITPAFQLGRRDSLLHGFKIGNPQGNGLTSIPVHTSWEPGFALTFSFSVAQ